MKCTLLFRCTTLILFNCVYFQFGMSGRQRQKKKRSPIKRSTSSSPTAHPSKYSFKWQVRKIRFTLSSKLSDIAYNRHLFSFLISFLVSTQVQPAWSGNRIFQTNSTISISGDDSCASLWLLCAEAIYCLRSGHWVLSANVLPLQIIHGLLIGVLVADLYYELFVGLFDAADLEKHLI